MKGAIEVKSHSEPGRQPGDTVDVTFAWTLDSAPDQLEARLFWYTEGKGTQDVGVVETQPLVPTMAGEQRVRFKLPQAPYSFSGSLISLIWAVELVADDIVGRWEFILAPQGTEIRLDAVSAPSGITTRSDFARA